MFRNRLLKAVQGGGSGLPSGYYRCEYIEGDGTQYIDTGFKPNQDTRVVADVYAPVSGSNWFVFGARTSSSNNSASSLTYGFNVYSTFYRTHYYDGWSNFGTAVSYTGRFTIDKDKETTTLDGTHTIDRTYTAFQCAYSMYLFACNTKGTAGTFGAIRMYSCQIYDNGTKVRDYVPCVNPEGCFGLYDKVTDAFYGSANDYRFRGKVILPDGYIWIECLYADGTQYIDTGFRPKYNSRVVMDVSDVPNSNQFIFGARDTSSATSPRQFSAYRVTGSPGLRSDYFGTNVTYALDDELFSQSRTFIDKNGNLTDAPGWSISITNTAVSSGECANTLYLFALNDNGSPLLYCSAKVYSCQIYDDGTMVRFFVPCINRSGVYGMYDMVNGVFYGSASGSPFTNRKWMRMAIKYSNPGSYYKLYMAVPPDREVYAVGIVGATTSATSISSYRDIRFSSIPVSDYTDYEEKAVPGPFYVKNFDATLVNTTVRLYTYDPGYGSKERTCEFSEIGSAEFTDKAPYTDIATLEYNYVDADTLSKMGMYVYRPEQPLFLYDVGPGNGDELTRLYILVDITSGEPEKFPLFIS